MKIIDLLNKIANGENISNNHMKYFDRQDQEYDICLICLANLTYKLDNAIVELNDEVEILEEEKKIPEKINVKNYDKCIHDVTHKEKEFSLDIRELQIRYNDLLDYLKSKGE